MPSTCNSPPHPYHCNHHPSSQCRQASWVPPLGRAGSLPQGIAHLVCRRRAVCLPGAVASQRAHPPAPPWEVLSVPALAGTRLPCPDRWTPGETPSCPCCQPVSHLPPYPAPPGPVCRSLLSPGLSSTVLIHAFVPDYRPGICSGWQSGKVVCTAVDGQRNDPRCT